MKPEQVDKALHQKFVTEGGRLVFWHDPNGEFADYVENGLTGEITDVHVLDVEKIGGPSAKLRLEHEDNKANRRRESGQMVDALSYGTTAMTGVSASK